MAGAIGPLGAHIEPLGPTSFAEARAIFREQADVLLEAGVDLLVLETFGNLDEMREALFAAREAAGPDMTIVAQVTIDDNGNLPGGTETEVFTRASRRVARGCHRRQLLGGSQDHARNRRAHDAVHLQADERHAQRGRAGARGGPQPLSVLAGIHGAIRAAAAVGRRAHRGRMLRHHARAHQADPRRGALAAAGAEEAGRHGGGAARPRRRPCRRCPWRRNRKLGAKLAAGKFVAFVEILPPRGVDASKEIAGAKLCAAQGIDCINVPDGPRASARMSAQVTCQLIQREAGIEAVNHFCCRDRNILSIQSELLGAHCAGVRNLICITGDPPRMGSYPDATAVFDVDAIGLVNIANNLNHGLDIGGNAMGSQTALLIGVGVNPGALNMDEEIRRFEWKVQAGAEYVVTQPVFDLDLLEQFLKRIEHVKIPVICGIWPLTSFRNAEFMVNELRVPVPEHFMERMRQVDNAEKVARGRRGHRARDGGAGARHGAGRTIERAVRALPDGDRCGGGDWAALGVAGRMATDLVEVDAEEPQPEAIERAAAADSPRAGWWPSPPTRCTRWWPIRSTCAPWRRCSAPRAARFTARCRCWWRTPSRPRIWPRS